MLKQPSVRSTLEHYSTLIIYSKHSFYQPPNRELQSVDNLCQLFTNLSSSYTNTPIWIVGNLNLPNIDWENNIQGGAYRHSLCDTVID